jgi:hypothetical protein
MREEPNNTPKKSKPNKKISSPEKIQIEELLESSLREYVIRQTKSTKNREELVSKVANFVSEYMSPFMLIGYDTKGQPINIVHAASQLDADALATAVNKLVFMNEVE